MQHRHETKVAAQVIDCADIDAARCPNHEERQHVPFPVRGDRGSQSSNVHRACRVTWNKAQCPGAKARYVQCPSDAEMDRRRRVGNQLRFADPIPSYRRSQCRASRDDDGDQIRDRRAGHHEAGRISRQPKHLCGPPDHLPFARDGCVVAAAAVRIQSRSQHFGQDAYGCAGSMYPAEESRMSIADCVRRNQPLIFIVDVRQRYADAWQGIAPGAAHIVRHRPPHGPRPDTLQFVENVIEHLVTQRAQPGPFIGVQRWVSVTCRSRRRIRGDRPAIGGRHDTSPLQSKVLRQKRLHLQRVDDSS